MVSQNTADQLIANMSTLNFKIAVRSFLKGKTFYLLNIGGLAMGLTTFVLASLYISNETSYDQWNKNVNRIFLVERELPNGPSPYTPGKLAAEIKGQCPEVEEVGRMNTALFQIPFFTPSGRFLIKKWVGADYSIAKILGIEPAGFKLNPASPTPAILLSKATAQVLFPNDSTIQNKTVSMMSKSGVPMPVAGIVKAPPGNTNFQFDCIGFSADITSGKDQSYATQIYQTFILVKPHADVKQLAKKIDAIYKSAALTDTSEVAKEALRSSNKPSVYLDALSNLHLKPHYGSQTNNQIVNGLAALTIIILLITAVNFTNLYTSQANKRSKEVGIKKVNGVTKQHIAVQFLLEIFIQCCAALLISASLVVIILPYFNQVLGVHLLLSGLNISIIAQIAVTLILLTLLAGLYPALIMAGFKPAEVLRGNMLSGGGRLSWLHSAITVVQVMFAVVFIITLIVINQQITFMRSDNPGFSAKQVLYIDNLALYNNPKSFKPVKDRIRQIAGVKNVTVASNVPGGILPVTHDYLIEGRPYAMNTISVDYDYFETLNIKTQQGHVFNLPLAGDSLNAVINQAAAKAMDLKNPVGKSIVGCGSAYKVIGVIKDVKAYGYEENVNPTIYLMNDHCGLSKTQIMISAESNSISTLLKTLGKQWPDINKLDGDNFNYHFLDELYGKLFIKQEQLRAVLMFFSALAVFIASLGFFSLAAHSINLRGKELAIRKVFGATGQHLLVILTKPFFRIVLIANGIAWPVALYIIRLWLQTFAYRISISVVPFVIALGVSLIIVFITVCLQVNRAVRFNPSVKLKA